MEKIKKQLEKLYKVTFLDNSKWYYEPYSDKIGMYFIYLNNKHTYIKFYFMYEDNNEIYVIEFAPDMWSQPNLVIKEFRKLAKVI